MKKTEGKEEVLNTEQQRLVLDAALAVISRGGFTATIVEKVAAKCAITAPRIFLHFGGTERLLEAILERQRHGRAHRFELMLERLRELGLAVDAYVQDEGAAAGTSLGRPKIARALVAAGYASSVDDAMRRLLARGRPAYVQRQGLGPPEAIAAITAAGGLPVLAHFPDARVRMDLVRELIGAGLRGLEVHYRRFDAETVAEMEALATELRLVPTGGSDYHGDDETYAEAHATIFVPEEDATLVLASLGRSAAGFPFEQPAP